MERARLICLFLAIQLALGFIVPIPFIQGQVAESHTRASASIIGDLTQNSPSPYPISLLYVYIVLLCISCVRSPLAWYAARRSTEEKLGRSQLLEKLASGELEDATEQYIWPLKTLARLAKPSLAWKFHIATKNIDWHCNPTRGYLPREWPLSAGTFILSLCVAAEFLVYFTIPNAVLDPYLGLLFLYALICLQAPIISANMATMSETARIALQRLAD